MNLRIGTSGYSYKEWKGKFYPKDLPARGMLTYYAERFNAVESNNSFYSMPKASVLESWTKQVPPAFQFALKAPQRITHFRRLKDVADLTTTFLDAASALGDRLGPLLFQLPPNMKKDAARLSDFLDLLPTTRRIAFEFRHESWHDDEILDLLNRRKVALCIAEADDGLQTPLVATAKWGYLRLRMVEYTKPELKKWLQKIRKQPWTDAYIFFKHEDEARGPDMAQQLMALAGS